MQSSIERLVAEVREYGKSHACQDVARQFDLPYEIAYRILMKDPHIMRALEALRDTKEVR